MLKYDLHCHSHFSDGGHSPEELVGFAKQAGVDVLALTDHDTVSGLNSLHEAIQKPEVNLQIINGIELSVRWKKYDIHVLGLNIDKDAPELLQLIEKQKNCRVSRAKQIAEKLEKIGLKDAYEKAKRLAAHGLISRPHFAAVLLEEGITSTMQQGFDRYLKRGKVAYIPTQWANLEEALRAVKAAKGVGVLAHPLKYGLTQSKLRELIETFKAWGGQGIEVISGEIMPDQVALLVKLCQQFNMYASTGSDFHHTMSSRIKLGGQGTLPLNCTPIWQSWAV